MPTDIVKCEFCIPAEISQIVPASERLIETLGCQEDFNFLVAIQEALANAVVHGSKLDGGKEIRCHAEVVGDQKFVTIRDSGPGFDYEHVPDPTTPEGIVKSGGRGLKMIRHLADEVTFEDGGATIRMRKKK